MHCELARTSPVSTRKSIRFCIQRWFNYFFNVAVKGLGADMLKSKSVRRRTKQQVKADKEAAALKEKQYVAQEKLLAGLPDDP